MESKNIILWGKPSKIEYIVYFFGKIYAVTNDSHIGILNGRCLELNFVSLVVLNKKLLNVDQFNISLLKDIEVYKIDLSRMEGIRLENLRDEALFLGDMISSRTTNLTRYGRRCNCV